MMPLLFRICLFALFLGTTFPITLYAQEAASDSTEVPAWEKDLDFKLASSQTGFQNWVEGGTSALAFSTGLDWKATRTSNSWEQVHETRLGYGLIKQDTLSFRKADDFLHHQSTFKYDGVGFFRHFRPTIAFSMRTQFDEGFNYEKDPFGEGNPLPVKVSDIFSPARFVESLGLTYQPATWFTQRLGIGGKQTVVMIERLRSLYGVEPLNPVRLEVGMEAYTEVDKKVFENVRYKSKLGLFASFNQSDKPDVFWENLVVMTVNKWLNVNFEFVSVFDHNVSNQVQFKEVLAVGVLFDLI